MNLVFWQNIISPHQAPFMKEMSDAGHEVLVVSTEEMSNDRRSLGWLAPSLGSARIFLNPTYQDVLDIVKFSEKDSIHFIAGARGTILGRQAVRACRASNRRIGIISEAPDTRGFSGFLRWVKYTYERLYIGVSFDFIMAMGQKGVKWFSICGYPSNKIFPFIYVTERSPLTRTDVINEKFRFIFVGRFVKLKGLDVLLSAFVNVPNTELVMVGDGPEKNRLQKIAKNLGISSRITWLGQLSAAKVQEQLSVADVLVLPSRKDGWGAVVNESLMLGTPVICSDACGAIELIRFPWLGSIFKVNNVDSLASAMLKWSSIGGLYRNRIRDWSQCIEARQIAKYLENVVNHTYNSSPRPKAPWLE